MPTQGSRDLFGYEVVEGRQVVAAFDGGEVTSDAGAPLLGAANRAIGLVRRLAGGFTDGRTPELVSEPTVTMPVGAGVAVEPALCAPHRLDPPDLAAICASRINPVIRTNPGRCQTSRAPPERARGRKRKRTRRIMASGEGGRPYQAAPGALTPARKRRSPAAAPAQLARSTP